MHRLIALVVTPIMLFAVALGAAGRRTSSRPPARPPPWVRTGPTSGTSSPNILAAYPDFEQGDFAAAAEAIERAVAAQPLGPIPLIVLTTGR